MCLVFVMSIVHVTLYYFFFFKQKTAYEMRISDWSSDVCSSDLRWRSWFRSGADRRLRYARHSARPCRTARPRPLGGEGAAARRPMARQPDRKSVVSGKSVSVLVDIGGRRIIKKKKNILNACKSLIIYCNEPNQTQYRYKY